MPAPSLPRRRPTRRRGPRSSVSSCWSQGFSSSTRSAGNWPRATPSRPSATRTAYGTSNGPSVSPARVRCRTLAVVTAAALVVHLVFPLAPPRMLAATGLIDTGQVYGPSVYGSPETDHLSNQFAAMPSLHFGWALMVAIGLIAATRSRWRRLWLLHPLLTLLVILGTANHYWLDAIVATAVLGLALAAILPQTPSGATPVSLRSPHRTATTAGRGAGKLVPAPRDEEAAEEAALVGAGR